MPKKIKDNESIQPLIKLLELGKFTFSIIDKIPFIYNLSPQIKSFKEQFTEIQSQSSIFTLPDQFNELFSKDGWICYGALNQSILKESIRLGLDNKLEEAKLLLISSIDENSIDLMLRKCSTREHFKLRIELLQLLKQDYLEERYHACIPLLLALIDGLANDISAHVGFFAEKSDLELFDSITAHKTALPFLKIIMNAARKNTTTSEIKIPYRNGILHGRDLNFANKEAASKCWWALACLIEWADEKVLNKQPQPIESFQSVLKKYHKQQNYYKRIESWRKRPCKSESYWIKNKLKNVEKDSPEYFLVMFLEAWKAKQWGKMTPLLLHNIQKHAGKATREVIKDYGNIDLKSFKIKYLEDQTPSSTTILTQLEFLKYEVLNSVEIDISLHYADSVNGLPELRGEENGKWYIQQLSLRDILFS